MSRHGSQISQSSCDGTRQGVGRYNYWGWRGGLEAKVQTVKKEPTRHVEAVNATKSVEVKKEDFESLPVGSVLDIDSILKKYNMKKALINLCWEGSLWVKEVMYETKAV